MIYTANHGVRGLCLPRHYSLYKGIHYQYDPRTYLPAIKLPPIHQQELAKYVASPAIGLLIVVALSQLLFAPGTSPSTAPHAPATPSAGGSAAVVHATTVDHQTASETPAAMSLSTPAVLPGAGSLSSAAPAVAGSSPTVGGRGSGDMTNDIPLGAPLVTPDPPVVPASIPAPVAPISQPTSSATTTVTPVVQAGIDVAPLASVPSP